MTDDEKLMQQTLEALLTCTWSKQTDAAIAALRERLAQPVQEPVASCQHKRYSVDVHEQTGHCFDCGAEGRMRFVVGNREQRDIARAAIAKAIGEQS